MKDRMAETIRSKLSLNNGKGYIYVENEDDKSLQLSTAKEARMPDRILSADDDVLSIEKLTPKLGFSIDDLRKMIKKQKDSMDRKPPPIENIASPVSTTGVSTLSSLSGTPSSIAST
jgi:hypothetical protein